MSSIKNSKSDDLNPTQSFDGGFINLASYSGLELTATVPPVGEHPIVHDFATGSTRFWDGSGWKFISVA